LAWTIFICLSRFFFDEYDFLQWSQTKEEEGSLFLFFWQWKLICFFKPSIDLKLFRSQWGQMRGCKERVCDILSGEKGDKNGEKGGNAGFYIATRWRKTWWFCIWLVANQYELSVYRTRFGRLPKRMIVSQNDPAARGGGSTIRFHKCISQDGARLDRSSCWVNVGNKMINESSLQ